MTFTFGSAPLAGAKWWIGGGLIILALGPLGGVPAQACAGCDSSYHCMYGIDQGGYLCFEAKGDCTLLHKIFGASCHSAVCTTFQVCDNRAPKSPEPDIEIDRLMMDDEGSDVTQCVPDSHPRRRSRARSPFELQGARIQFPESELP